MPDRNQWGEPIPEPDDFRAWAIRGYHEHFETIEGEWGPYGLADFERRYLHNAPAWLVDGVRTFAADERKAAAELRRRLRHEPPDLETTDEQ